jgi:hypothetical protein
VAAGEAMALVVGWAVGKGIGVSSASNSGTEAKISPGIPDTEDKKVARAFLLGPVPRKTPGISRMTRSSYPG